MALSGSSGGFVSTEILIFDMEKRVEKKQKSDSGMEIAYSMAISETLVMKFLWITKIESGTSPEI